MVKNPYQRIVNLTSLISFVLLLLAASVQAIAPGSGWKRTIGPNGEVRTLFGSESLPLPGTTPQARAQAFLRQQATTFRLSPDLAELELDAVRHDRLGDHVRFRHQIAGLEVVGEAAEVHLRGDRAYLTSSNVKALVLDPLFLALTREAALAVLLSLDGSGPQLSSLLPLSSKLPLTPTTPGEAVIWPVGERGLAAWRFQVSDARGLPYTALVDAESHVHLQPRFHDFNVPIYPKNPISTPVREIRTLTGLDASSMLKGPYADVKMKSTFGFRGPTAGTRIGEAGEGFRFHPGDGKMAAVNAFYHVNRVHDFYESLGVTGLDDYALPILVRFQYSDGQPFDSAVYAYPDPTTRGVLLIGVGPEGEDYGLDSDVLYHEYTHYTAAQINEGFTNSVSLENGALNEGFADFGASTLSGDACTAEFFSPLNDPEGRACLRDLRTRRRYPKDTGETTVRDRMSGYTGFTEPHVLGELISGTLWDLRNALGAEKSNHLFVSILSLLNGASGLPDVRATLLSADQQLYASADAATIEAVFDARGIGTQAAKYLAPDAFTTLNSKATVFIGPLFQGGGEFRAFLEPMDLGATLVAGRNYTLSGAVVDRTASSVTLKVLDALGQPMADLTKTQGVTSRTAAVDMLDGSLGEGRYFSFPLTFPQSAVGQTATLSMTFTTGTATWTNTASVQVVAESGPAPLLTPEPAQTEIRPLGDVDGDRRLTTADAVLALRLVVGLDPQEDARVLPADLYPAFDEGTTGDDRVSLPDVITLLRRIVGLKQ